MPRTLLRLTVAALTAALLALAVGACGSSDDDGSGTSATAAAADSTTAATPAPPETEKLTIALDWAANVNYLGIYAAIANGYFEQQGIEPEILPYANTPAETLIRNGKADLGITYPPDVIINRSQGLRYKTVAALLQENTTELVVKEDSPYRSPADLSGKTFGGFGVQSSKAIIDQIMRNDGVARPVFREIVLNVGAVDAVGRDRVDYSAVFGGIDDIQAELRGIRLRKFPYKDYLDGINYPNAVYVAGDDTISERGDVLRRGLAALARGYEFAAQNPAEAEQILIDENKTELSNAREIVVATGNAVAPTLVNADGVWGPLRESDFTGLADILVDGGVIRAAPPVADYLTNELLPDGGS